MPVHLDVHVRDGGIQNDVNGYFASLIKQGEFHPCGVFYSTTAERDHAIQKLVDNWSLDQNPLGRYWVFRDLRSKGEGYHVIYCYTQPSNAGPILQRFIAGHEEMHAYVFILSSVSYLGAGGRGF